METRTILIRWPRMTYCVAGVLATALCWSLAIRGVPAPAQGFLWAPFIVLFVFAVMRWRGRKEVRPLFFAVGIGLTYVFVVGKLLYGPGIEAYLHQRSFDAATWQRKEGWNTHWPARLTMVDDLLARHQLRGMTRDSLVRLLGPADSTQYFAAPNHLVYWLGPERGFMSIDSEWLVVTLGPDGHVSDAEFFATRPQVNTDELMRLHVEALFTHDARGDLLRVNEPSGAAAPRFFLGQTPAGLVLRYRGDVAEETRQELAEAASLEIVNDLPNTPETYREILASTAPVEKTWSGPAFAFPDRLRANDETILITEDNAHYLQRHLSSWLGDVHTCAPIMALIVDDAAVAVCGSVRITDRACEAGVETTASARGRGYAGRVVSAWASAVHAEGKTPLYSTSWHNEASRAVARKLGLTQFGTDLHIT